MRHRHRIVAAAGGWLAAVAIVGLAALAIVGVAGAPVARSLWGALVSGGAPPGAMESAVAAAPGVAPRVRTGFTAAPPGEARAEGEASAAAPVPEGPWRRVPEAVSPAAPELGPRSREPEPPAPIELDALERGPITAHVHGHDPGAPRALWLWRRVGEEAAVMARGESREDGSLVFPALIVPDAGLDVVLTPAGEGPGGDVASAPRSLPARALAAPRTRWVDGGEALRILPTEASGEVWLAGADGAVFGRHPVPPSPSAAGRVFEIEVALAAGDTGLWIAHARPDGRISDWERIELPAVTTEESP